MDLKKTDTVGIYPGSFNPFHIGHLDIVRQAQKVFDKVFVVRAINPEKAKAAFKLPEDFLFEMGVGCMTHDGLVSDFIKKWEDIGYDATLIRGLRSGADLGYEQNLVAFLRNMYPQIKVVFFFATLSINMLAQAPFEAYGSFPKRNIKNMSWADKKQTGLDI